jgi:hypothetical protein
MISYIISNTVCFDCCWSIGPPPSREPSRSPDPSPTRSFYCNKISIISYIIPYVISSIISSIVLLLWCVFYWFPRESWAESIPRPLFYTVNKYLTWYIISTIISYIIPYVISSIISSIVLLLWCVFYWFPPESWAESIPRPLSYTVTTYLTEYL